MPSAPRVPATPVDPELANALPGLGELMQDDARIRAVAAKLKEDQRWRERASYQMLVRLRQLKPDARARPRHPQHVAAFFDVDGTLLRGSIIMHLFAQGFLAGQANLFHVVQFATCFLLYKLNLIPALTMYRWGYAPAAGHDLREVQDYVDRCLATRIKPAVFQDALDTVAAHRAAGHRCVAITGAPDYPAAELCAALGLQDILATPTPLTEDGAITTNVQEPVCYAAGKLAFLRAYAAAHDIDLERSFLYSDSASDIPVLRAVGLPRVVNAQWLLLPAAWWHRWPRARWRGGGGAGTAGTPGAPPPPGAP